jgi:hypothetical protein
MDDARFDTLTKSLTRRPVLRFLVGALVGTSVPLLGEREAAARCRRGPCRNGTCQGCCTSRDCCKPGTSRKACGTGGEACTSRPGCCTDNDCGSLRCSGGVCAQNPGCTGAGSPCPTLPHQSCCGECFASLPMNCLCSSGMGRPCQSKADCCDADAACIGFYCGGCRGEGQRCDTPGVNCCGQFLCQGGFCLDPTPSG